MSIPSSSKRDSGNPITASGMPRLIRVCFSKLKIDPVAMFRRRDRTAVQRPFIGSHEFGIAAIINNYACGIINRTKDTAVCGINIFTSRSSEVTSGIQQIHKK